MAIRDCYYRFKSTREIETNSMAKMTTPRTWPYVFVLFVACVLTFASTMMLGFLGIDPEQRVVGSLAVFVALAAGLMFYARCCLASPVAAPASRTPPTDEGS
jgi:hypothetical protein